MKNDVPLNVVIGLSSISGSVQLAKCNCKASALARCAHTAALLLKITDFAKNNGYTVISPSTSKSCVWKTGEKRKKNPKTIHEENYSSKKFFKDRIINWVPRPVNFRERPNDQDINEFVKDLQSKLSKIWTETGYNNMQGFFSDCKKHEKAKSHLEAYKTWKTFDVAKRVDVLLWRARRQEIDRHNEEVRQNREMLKILSEATLFLGKQELSFRGHNESEGSLNKGNYLELLECLANFDSILEHRLHGRLADPKRASSGGVFKGVSSDVQNDLIECTDSVIQDQIDKEIQHCTFLSMQVDETTDVSTKEQLNIIVCLDRKGEIVEKLLKFVNVSQDRSAPAITAIVKNILSKYGESLKEKIVMQTYHGATVMSWHIGGVQTLLRQDYPFAYFFHCPFVKSLGVVKKLNTDLDELELWNRVQEIWMDIEMETLPEEVGEDRVLALNKRVGDKGGGYVTFPVEVVNSINSGSVDNVNLYTKFEGKDEKGYCPVINKNRDKETANCKGDAENALASPWSSPVLLLEKPNVDYRGLNEATKKETPVIIGAVLAQDTSDGDVVVAYASCLLKLSELKTSVGSRKKATAGQWIRSLTNNLKPKDKNLAAKFERENDQHFITENVCLFQRFQGKQGKNREQIIVPKTMVEQLLVNFHHGPLSGHPGFFRTYRKKTQNQRQWYVHYVTSFIVMGAQKNFPRSKELVSKEQLRQNIHHDQHIKELKVKVGDKVWLGDFIVKKRTSTKFHNPWIGLYEVAKVIVENNVKIIMPKKKTRKLKRVIMEQIKMAQEIDGKPENIVKVYDKLRLRLLGQRLVTGYLVEFYDGHTQRVDPEFVPDNLLEEFNAR
eukprot:gene5751-11021_t